MWKSILIFLLANLVFIVLVVALYAIGFEYDKANKLYPETVQLSYDVSISGVYGQRWVRLAQTLISFGVIIDFVMGFIWYRKIQSKGENKISIYDEESFDVKPKVDRRQN